MKKVLLSSVAALAVFAATAPVFAEDGAYGLGATRWSNESGVWVDNNDVAATPDQIKDYNDKDLGTKSEQWTRDANPLKDKEHLKVDKGEAVKAADQKAADQKADAKKEDKKAPAAAGQKALPKTSAVK